MAEADGSDTQDARKTDADSAREAADSSALRAQPQISAVGTGEDSLDSRVPIGGGGGNHADEAQVLLIEELRRTISELTSQVDSLNTKLVSSLERTGDLEDSLAQAQDEASKHRQKIESLQTETNAHQTLVDQGLLVEKRHVQAEMQKLMEKVMEESRQRGQAEQDYMQYKSEVDDLSASLFDEANKMVSVERQSRAAAELKSSQFAERLRDTEGLIADQQAQMQALKEQLDASEDEIERLKAHSQGLENILIDASTSLDENLPRDDKRHKLRSDPQSTISRPPSRTESPAPAIDSIEHPFTRPLPTLLRDHPPYEEFVNFVRYLRRLKVMNQNAANAAGLERKASGSGLQNIASASLYGESPPVTPFSSYLGQPFLKRCVEEDSDATLRLDLAPGLSWLSRRQVSTALIDGTLVIEPVQEPKIPFTTCTLCGRRLQSGSQRVGDAAKTRWMSTLNAGLGSFSRSSSSGSTSQVPPSFSNHSQGSIPFSAHDPSKPVVHVFRTSETANQRYALCAEYCLARLRTSAEFWNYLRMIERSLSTDNFKLNADTPTRAHFDQHLQSGWRRTSSDNSTITVDGVSIAVLDAASASPAAALAYQPHAISDRSMSEGSGPPLPTKVSSMTPEESLIVDRSWPVIVKLKEKMFWVRIGFSSVHLPVDLSSTPHGPSQQSQAPVDPVNGDVGAKKMGYGHGRSGSGELSVAPRRPIAVSATAANALYVAGSPAATSAPDLNTGLREARTPPPHLAVPPSPLGCTSSVPEDFASSTDTLRSPDAGNVYPSRSRSSRGMDGVSGRIARGDEANMQDISLLPHSPSGASAATLQSVKTDDADPSVSKTSPGTATQSIKSEQQRSPITRNPRPTLDLSSFISPATSEPNDLPSDTQAILSSSEDLSAPAVGHLRANVSPQESSTTVAATSDTDGEARIGTPTIPAKSRARRTAPIPPPLSVASSGPVDTANEWGPSDTRHAKEMNSSASLASIVSVASSTDSSGIEMSDAVENMSLHEQSNVV